MEADQVTMDLLTEMVIMEMDRTVPLIPDKDEETPEAGHLTVGLEAPEAPEDREAEAAVDRQIRMTLVAQETPRGIPQGEAVVTDLKDCYRLLLIEKDMESLYRNLTCHICRNRLISRVGSKGSD